MRAATLVAIVMLSSVSQSAVAREPLTVPTFDVPPGAMMCTIPDVPPQIRGALWKEERLRHREPARPLPYEGMRESYDNVVPARTDFSTVDVDVFVDLDHTDFLEVTTQIRMRAMETTVDRLTFTASNPNLADAVALSGPGIVAAEINNGTLELDFEGYLPTDVDVVLEISTYGPLVTAGDPMLSTSRLNGDIWYVTHSQFMPTKNSMDDVFTGAMTLHVSGTNFANTRAGGTGTLVETELDTDAGVKRFVLDHIFPTSLYAFAVSDYIRLHGGSDELAFSVFADPSQTEGGTIMLGIIHDVVERYSDYFVEYPWNKLDAVAMPSSFSGGFGPLSTVMMMVDVFDVDSQGHGYYGSMQLAAHEIGHQWWGNLVEMGDRGAIFLSEGLAEFSSNYYVEDLTDNRWPFASNNLSYVYTVPHDQEPSMASPFVYSSPYYYQVAYQKGACVANSLRTELGDDLFFQFLSTFSERYHMDYATIDDFFEVLQEVAGESMEWFYQQWFIEHSPAYLVVGGKYDSSDQSFTFHVQQEEDRTFRMTLPIWIEFKDGSYQEERVLITEISQEFEFVVEQPVLRVLIDPRFHQLRRLYPLLPGDIDLNGVVDGRDLVEMSFAYSVNIVYPYQGGEYFIPNANYKELADLGSDDGEPGFDGKVNDTDVDIFTQNFGTRIETVLESPDQEE